MSSHNGQVGFVGTGTMGAAMVARLLDEGVEPLLHDVHAASAAPLLERGARWAPSLEDLAGACDVVLLSLPGPPQVEAVVAGPGGLLSKLAPGATIVDLSTNSVATVRELHERCRERGVAFLDSPVSGGSKGSREGSLVLMVGGEAEVVERQRALLEKLSRSLHHLGGSGAGTIAKLVHNQLYLCGQVLFYEGLVLAAKGGLDIPTLIEILDQSGAGGIHAKLADRVLERRYDDDTFALALAEKDVALGLEAGRSLEVPMPTAAAAYQLFVEARAAGLGDKNFWAAIELVEKRAATRVSPDGESE
jgi:3-hydroxyisobutyrate dehydrogenase